MQEILFHYQKIHPMNWVYLSSLLAIALYFKFSRLWSVRNADLIGLILLAPGLVLIEYGRSPISPDPAIEFAGFIWLFCISSVFLFRMLADSWMVRRPMLEPNLSVGGMTWLGVSLLVFLMSNVANSDPDGLATGAEEIVVAENGEEEAEEVIEPGQFQSAGKSEKTGLQKYGPRFPLLSLLPRISTQTFFAVESDKERQASLSKDQPQIVVVTKTIAILSQLAIVAGLVVIGYMHFDNIRTGIAAAVLYLLLPYTAEMTGHIPHCLPAAVLVWAVAMYRRPMVSGLLMGTALACIYYPFFLLPLWISFYWQRGLLRFIGGVVISLAISIGIIAISSVDLQGFVQGIRQMLGLAMPRFEDLKGVWIFVDPIYRLPIIATFVALGGSFAFWPGQKNLGTLLSGSAALMLGAQFWHGEDGGLCMAWYLPVLLLTIFRPNLEDRVAQAVLQGPRTKKRRATSVDENIAA